MGLCSIFFYAGAYIFWEYTALGVIFGLIIGLLVGFKLGLIESNKRYNMLDKLTTKISKLSDAEMLMVVEAYQRKNFKKLIEGVTKK